MKINANGVKGSFQQVSEPHLSNGATQYSRPAAWEGAFHMLKPKGDRDVLNLTAVRAPSV